MRNRCIVAWAWLLAGVAGPFAVQAAEPPVEADFSYDELQLEFAEPMRVWDNQVRRDLVRTTPALPLSCHWDDDVLLLCETEAPARPQAATRYRVDLASGLVTQQGAAVPAQVLYVDTERPQLRAHVDNWDEGMPRFKVMGNMAMTVADVRAVLKVRVGERDVSYSLERLPPSPYDSDERNFRLTLSGDPGPDARVRLQVVPGLRSEEGALRGRQQESLLVARANESFRVRSVSCRQRRDDELLDALGPRASVTCLPDESITIVVSRMPDAASRARFAARLPAGVAAGDWQEGSFYYGQGRRGERDLLAQGAMLQLTVTPANARVTLALDDMTDEAGAPLAPLVLDVRTTDAQPRLKAAGERVLLDRHALPQARLQGINAGGTPLRVTGLGRTLRTSEARAPAAPPNTMAAVTSPTDDHALREGGWSRWEVMAVAEDRATYMRTPGDVEFAAPDFDLAAWAGQREVIAWARDWSDDQPIATARVELLLQASADAPPQTLTETRTDRDGVAALSLPDGYVLPDALDGQYPRWWLRSTHGTGARAERAILPLGASQRYGLRLGAAARRYLWGVSDRPMYIAGSTVQYQLWQRERVAGRLQRIARPEPVELGLVSVGEAKTVLRWQAAPDAQGVIHAGLSLPVHLTDGTYCIGAPDADEETGACFFVGTYRAQDLWARADAQDRVLREGDTFVFDIEAGYYSGGPAADMPLARISTMLTGLPLQTAYPRYADYTFIDVWASGGRGGIALKPSTTPVRTDADGKARIALPVAFPSGDSTAVEPPAFGTLQAVVEAKPSEREGTVSNAAKVRYARHARYVGLRSEPRWWDAKTPLQLQAVVIDAEGNEMAGAPVEVQVDYLGQGWREDSGTDVQRLTTCTLVAGKTVPCDAPRTRSGRYRVVARSGDAAPATLVQYVWAGDATTSTGSRDVSLALAAGEPQSGAPVTVVLTQPQARATALFVFRQHDEVLGHQVAEVHAGAQEVALRLPAGAQGPLNVRVFLRDRGAIVEVAPGYRAPVPLQSAGLDIVVPRLAQAPALTVALRADNAQPGQPARLLLTNTSDRPRQVAVAVTDDALRAMAGQWLAYADPLGRYWLGREAEYGGAWSTGFHEWRSDGWRWSLPWPRAVKGDLKAATPGEHFSPPRTSPLPPPPQAPLMEVSEPQPTDIAVPSSPPAPPAAAAYEYDRGVGLIGGGDGASLDKIQVTGSRIDLTDIFMAGERPPSDLRPREQGAAQSPLARVRTRFADTAFWQAGIVLAPGESRSFDIALPDNLTRWRAVAWSGDADDGFEQVDTALEIGLPVEARLQVPVRLYPGDSARLAAHLRQAGETKIAAQARIAILGDGVVQREGGERALTLAPRGQASVASTVEPTAVGAIQVVASVDAPTGRDAIATPIEIASPRVVARRVQAGWLDDARVALPLPLLPAGASDAHLAVDVSRGGAGLLERWTRDLHAYPHRCWEQILSRAVGAALAIERGDTASWPDAATAVREALDNAAVFQGDEGGMRYFADEPGMADDTPDDRGQVVLTAYTLQAFAWLRQRGHAVPAQVEKEARAFLARQRLPAVEAPVPHRQVEAPADAETRRAYAAADAAMAAAEAAAAAADAAAADDAGADVATADAVVWRVQRIASGDDDAVLALAAIRTDQASLDGVWRAWSRLALPARIAGLRALAAARHPAAADALASVLARFPARGLARHIDRDDGWARWMGSRMREQCALAGVLNDYPALADRQVRDALLKGLVDLYAGGVASVDTQTGAYCLVAVQGAATTEPAQQLSVQAGVGGLQATLSLPVGETRARWSVPQAPADGDTLTLTQAPGQRAWLGYVAEVDYQEDARHAQPSAVGLSLARHYEVLRDGRWQSPGTRAVQEGDWIRVTLVVQTASPHHFVALTDDVPGGLRPTDLALSAVAGLDLKQVSSTGSTVFRTRKLDPRAPKFYAEYLPAGRHDVHYFARVANAGDYLAAPATAELMYGNASHARTAADRLRISPSP
ncbi:alpha-2-macroglobulin family protein [Pseudoxanthomonas sp. Root65]|uniref:alpha-2-macroglobulin family protein n=1 Tax=Pseudoxanthomonas sp. Root65 TaxID=1736576 RepID=UPI0012E34FCB|nr:alpha-2-macroglobulin family protein [Pseudoxanthomonas sp. Root65]